MKKNKKGLLIGLVAVIILTTIMLVATYQISSQEDKGYVLTFAPLEYLVVLLGYAGVVAIFYLIKGVFAQVKLPANERISFFSFIKRHVFAIIVILFIVLGLLGFWKD